jgi:hypothetical protein
MSLLYVNSDTYYVNNFMIVVYNGFYLQKYRIHTDIFTDVVIYRFIRILMM